MNSSRSIDINKTYIIHYLQYIYNTYTYYLHTIKQPKNRRNNSNNQNKNIIRELRKTSSSLIHTMTKETLNISSKLTMMFANSISELASDGSGNTNNNIYKRYVL